MMPFLAAALWLLGAPAAAGDDSPKVYSMPPATYLYQENLWREYQRRHGEQQQAERAKVERLNRQALEAISSPAAYDAPAPARAERRPSRPPEMREFSDEFSRVVEEYVAARRRRNKGVFIVEEPASGRPLRLKLKNIPSDQIKRLGPGEVSGPVYFETVEGARKIVELDFFLTKEDLEWAVAKVLVAGAAGPARPAAETTRKIPKPKAPAHLTAQVSFREPSGDNVLDGGETGVLSVTVSNAGPGAAYAIGMTLAPQAQVSGLSVPPEVELGDLEPGQSSAREILLEASPEVAAGTVKILLSIHEGNGFDTEPVLIDFETRQFQAPKLELSGLVLGGDGVVKAGEATKVSMTVRNAGQGPAKDVLAVMELGSSDLFMSGESSVSLGTLKPGQSAVAEFEFFANKRFRRGDALPVSVSAGGRSFDLNLTVGQAPAAARVVTIKGGRGDALENVDEPPASRTRRDPDAYAVVVGIEKYRDVPGVDYAQRDAQIMHAYLTGAMGFDPKNVVLLQNQGAALTDMATYLGPWLKDHVDEKSRIFIYYAGHGAVDPQTGEAYLIPYDGNPSYVQTKALSVDSLYGFLAKLPSKNIIVALDSCFSGAGGRSVIAKGARPLILSRKAPPVGANMVVLTAAGGSQISTHLPEAEHGLFSYFLFKGLRGSADADKDGKVTTAELFGYVLPSVERQARKQHVEQTPAINPAVESLGKKGGQVWLRMK